MTWPEGVSATTELLFPNGTSNGRRETLSDGSGVRPGLWSGEKMRAMVRLFWLDLRHIQRLHNPHVKLKAAMKV